MLSFGLVGIVYKIALGRIDSISLVFFVYLFSTILTAMVWFTSVDKTITTSGLLLTFLASVLAVVGMLSYVYALKYGKVVIVVPINYSCISCNNSKRRAKSRKGYRYNFSRDFTDTAEQVI
jgi:uncharacterized membrane protein